MPETPPDGEQEGAQARLRHADRWSGALLALVGAYLAYEAAQLRFGTVAAPAAGFFPLLLAIGLTLLAAWIAVRPGAQPEAGFEHAAGHSVALAGGLCVLAVLIDSLGFVVCATVMMLALFRSISRLSWPGSIVSALSSVLLVYVFFSRLGVPLPKGLLPF